MIKKRNNYLILFGIIFSVFLFPKDVFAESYSCLSPSDSNLCMEDNYSKSALALAEKNSVNFLYLNIGNTKYKAYFFRGSSGSIAYSFFDLSNIGISLLRYDNNLDKLTGNWISYGNVFDEKKEGSNSGFIAYDDIQQRLPYFQLYESSGLFKYTLFFTYTDDVLVTFDASDSSNPFTVAVPISESNSNELLAMSFVSLYVDDENKTILFGLYDNVATTYNNFFVENLHNYDGNIGSKNYKVGDKYYTAILRPRWAFADTTNPKYDYSVVYTDDNISNIFSNKSKFTSNSNLIDSNGNLVDYNYKQDISNNSSSNPVSSFEVPTSLADILAMIPELMSQMVSAFAVVGTIFTTAMISFPPIITVGLYSVFILGIVILIIKTLK